MAVTQEQAQEETPELKNSKKEEWEQRLNALEEQIKYWINPTSMTNKTIETIQLFYDV